MGPQGEWAKGHGAANAHLSKEQAICLRLGSIWTTELTLSLLSRDTSRRDVRAAYDLLMEIHLNLSLTREELNDSRLYHDGFSEVVRIDTDEVRAFVPQATVDVSRGSIGKGVANWGVDVILVITTLANMDALIDLGARLVKLVSRLTGVESHRGLVIRDATTAGILAIGRYGPPSDLAEGEILGTRCVSGGSPEIGFDARDVWVTSVLLSDRSILEIRISAAGEFLGAHLVRPNS